ncbi:hypothetical protein YYC_02135, partial [Plasmodium yoelii 17X]
FNKFVFIRTNFIYQPNNRNYKFINNEHFKEYCNNQICDSDLDKINAACLYLFDELFGSS